ncbi:hypothetical protein [Bdellovibrio sp. ArHS]|uniref:hypothetical protein n=1 Tax=Bdellovibrio sp. ArHS TaxID=1569284 RepID=UPI000A7EBB3D|nr:hypothetical protein [Bdellovibrio sp. ArHS]
MFIRFFCLIILSFAVSACNKPDPNPELKDPIYSDLNTTLAAANAALEAEKKALEGFQKELVDVVPQTGQIKYAQKRVFESQQKISRLEQEKQYLELKLEARKKSSKKAYLAAFKKGDIWPNPKEFEDYQAEKKLREAKRTWDVKQRMQEMGFGDEKAPAVPAEASH